MFERHGHVFMHPNFRPPAAVALEVNGGAEAGRGALMEALNAVSVHLHLKGLEPSGSYG